ncbi:hypothetical protein FGB62_69g241 [Gracilaria domingensis]|nr:hypothetical protein FGB62_69g241 [Gracilaria domingensis]
MAAELSALTRQFNDVRSKLSRKVRHLEAELTSINSSSTATSTQPSRSSRPRVVNAAAPPHEPQPLAPSSSSRAFARVQSLGSVSESTRRRSIRPVTLPMAHSSSGGPAPVRRPFENVSDTNVASPASRARQSLIRRAFVAHIHAHRYRAARQAWLQFLGAERQQVTLVTFSACVRQLAVASEASDRELQLLMQEICEVGVGPHTVMTWNMFSRFYNSTKNEST